MAQNRPQVRLKSLPVPTTATPTRHGVPRALPILPPTAEQLRKPGEPEYIDRTIILSRALHTAVEPFIREDWPKALRVITNNIAKQRARTRGPLVRGWIDEWEQAAQRGPEAVIELSRTPGERGNDLRQMTPLAGVLPFELQQKIARETPRVS